MMLKASSRKTPELAVRSRRMLDLRAAGLLLLVTLPWWLALRAPLILLDDLGYITENGEVMSGLSMHSLAGAFSSTRGAFYIPVTWMSLALDVTLFGKGAAGFHFTNVVLHIANTMLVYLFFRRATGEWGRSVVIAGLFSIHPLRVESVAWAVERKDVLAAFFGLLAMHAYLSAVRGASRRGRMAGQAVTAVLFAVSLLAKPVLVPLPFLLLLLDIWPLGRWRLSDGLRRLAGLFGEKWLLFGASAAVVLVNYRLQARLGGIAPWPLGSRLANAVVSYAMYLRDQVYFQDLAIYYPFEGIAAGKWLAALAVVAGVTIGVVVLVWKGRRVAVAVGWCWFLGMLAPNIGIVQSGMQARADRFTYFPSLGLLVMVCWLLPGSALEGRGRKFAAWAAGGGMLALGVYTTLRLLLWAQPIALYMDTLEHTGPNPVMEFVIGRELQNARNIPEAQRHFERAVELLPGFHEAHDALGTVYTLEHRFPDALREFETAHDLAPQNPYYSMKIDALRAQLASTRPASRGSGEP